LLKICKIALSPAEDFITRIFSAFLSRKAQIRMALNFRVQTIRRASSRANRREDVHRHPDPQARRDHGNKNPLAKPFGAL
jgi:hypothetical protein